MRPLILGLVSLAIAILYEVPAYLCRFLPLPRRRERVSDVAIRATDRFVAAAKAYISLRLEYESSGIALPDRFIVVSNHQSLLDIPILIHFFKNDRRILFVAKKELGYGIPLISSVLKVGGHAIIDRGNNPSRSMKALGSFARRCEAGGFCPAIFPEGTRSKDGRIGKFSSAGLRRIVLVAPAPILVVAIDGGWKLKKLSDLLSSGGAVEYKVKVLEVIDAIADKDGVSDALHKAHDAIGRQLEAWRSA